MIENRSIADIQTLITDGDYHAKSSDYRQLFADLIIVLNNGITLGAASTDEVDTYTETIDLTPFVGALSANISFGDTLDESTVSATLVWPAATPISSMVIQAGSMTATGLTLDFSDSIVAGASVNITGKKKIAD